MLLVIGLLVGIWLIAPHIHLAQSPQIDGKPQTR
ncbi:hypothetical protein LEP3755_65660 (plasmid) [Leptolyngbya sp. NIES-3755]|nr:hypothetical protein LEP3755_65660 [Leptolyngbya sp. NIES-3755]